MQFTKMTPARWVAYFVMTVAFLIVFAASTFDSLPVGIALAGLVVAVGVAACFARPSVRQSLSLFVTLYHANRAAIRGDYGRAERFYARAVSQADRFGTNRDASLGTTLSHLADVYRNQGHLADAEPILERALGHMEVAARLDPARADLHWRNREIVALNLAAVYINQGRYAEAESLCREALAALQSDPAGGETNRAIARHNLGQILVGRGRYAEAEDLTRQALAALAPNGKRGGLGAWVTLSSLADLCRRQGRLDEAEQVARRALGFAEKSMYGPAHPQLARFLNVLAEVVRQQGHLDEAESLCVRSQALTEKAFGPEHLRLDGCLAALARIRAAGGRLDEAEALLRRCLSILDPVVVPDHPELVARREEYAAVLRQLGRAGEAEKYAPAPRPTAICQGRPESGSRVSIYAKEAKE